MIVDSNDPELAALAYWKKALTAWAVFFTLSYLISLIVALSFRASIGRPAVWAALFVALHWAPPALCRKRMFLPAGLLSVGIGLVWLVRVIGSYGSLVKTIRTPSAQGVLGEAAFLVIGITTIIVFGFGGFSIYRAARNMMNRRVHGPVI